MGVIFPTPCPLSPPGTNTTTITANPAVRFLTSGESNSKGNELRMGIVYVSVTCHDLGLEKFNYRQLSGCLSASEAHSIFLPSSRVMPRSLSNTNFLSLKIQKQLYFKVIIMVMRCKKKELADSCMPAKGHECHLAKDGLAVVRVSQLLLGYSSSVRTIFMVYSWLPVFSKVQFYQKYNL